MRGFGAFLAFLGGGLIGALAMNAYWADKHEKELKEVRTELGEYYRKELANKTEIAASETHEELERTKTALVAANYLIDTMKKREVKQKTRMEEAVENETVYVIKPDEFGTRPGYDKFTYTFEEADGLYYTAGSSGFLEPITPEERKLMFHTLSPEDHFGEFEDSAVYIRNEDLKTDIAVYLAAPESDIEIE